MKNMNAPRWGLRPDHTDTEQEVWTQQSEISESWEMWSSVFLNTEGILRFKFNSFQRKKKLVFYFRSVPEMSEDKLLQPYPSKLLSCIHRKIKPNY